jgi:hypothetical protein
MSENINIENILVRDTKLMALDKATYEVYQGPLNVTISTNPVTSQSNDSLSFNIQVPNLSVVMGKRIQISTRIGFVMNIKTPSAPSLNGLTINNLFPFQYGSYTRFNSFPLQRLFSTAQCTINNSNINILSQEIIPALMQLLDPETIQKYNMTPARTTNYLNNEDSQNSFNAQGGGYENTYGLNLPNGAYPLDAIAMSVDGVNYTPFNPLSIVPIVSVYFSVSVKECLILSPFIFADIRKNTGGMHGLTTLNFVFNVSSDVRRSIMQNAVVGAPDVSFSLASPSNSPLTAQSAFSNCSINLEYVSPPKDVVIPDLNIHQYLDFTRYPTMSNTTILPQGDFDITSSVISIGRVPDGVMVYVRKAFGTQTCYDTDFAMSISKINILFANDSGILASANQSDLYWMSREAGVNLDYLTWSGKAHVTSASSSDSNVPLMGSYLYLKFGQHIQLRDDCVVGQLGNFQISVQVQGKYQQTLLTPSGSARPAKQTAPITAELIVMPITSGFFVNNNGESYKILGPVSQSQAREALKQQPIDSNELDRMVGGSFFDDFKSKIKQGANFILPLIRKGLALIPDPRAQAVSEGLKTFGYAHKQNRLKGHGYNDDENNEHIIDSRLLK